MRWFVIGLALSVVAVAQDVSAAPPPAPAIEDRDLQIRDRYEKAILASPLQEQAFDRIYDSYFAHEGLEAWVGKLKKNVEADPNDAASFILLGRVYDRQFKVAEAIRALEQAKALGEDRPEFNVLLGTLYYDAGRNADAIELLGASLDAIPDPDQRARAVRILGSLYLREGKKEEAAAAWKRLTESNPNDTFALLELAAIYEENQMWDDAVATYLRIADVSAEDPYRRCRALRSTAQAYLHQEKYPDAIATFEKALELVAPGNWLFEDLKVRLVTVYQDMGDLEGLARYVQEKLAVASGDLEFRDLLAETYTRMTKFDLAEAEYKSILERDPQRSAAYEKLIALYQRMERPDEAAAAYEKLIALFPSEPDYLRRLGESYLMNNQPEAARKTWERIVADDPSPADYAQLAQWYEEYEFPDEAVAAYEKALQGKRDKEWAFRLAALKHEKGESEAALEIWTSTLDEATSTAGDYAEVASVLESHNYPEKAGPLLAKAVEKEPENPEYTIALAKNLMRQERAEEALPYFEKLATVQDNEYFRDQGERGMMDAYNALGILEEKQKEWEREAETHADQPGPLIRLARLYERLGDRAKAVELYERCVELAPDNAKYLRTLATAYKSGGRLQDAIDTYLVLIEKDKDRAGGYYRELMQIYLDADLKDQAIEMAKKIVEIAPSNPEARLDLAQVHMTYQQYDEGLAQYRYALRLEPNEPDYYRQYGEALESQPQLGEALEAYRKMFDTAKEDETRRSAATQMSRIYLAQGRLGELTREFQDRIRNTPKKLAAYQDLAAIYATSGDTIRAIEALESGLDAVDEKVPALQALVRAAFEAQDFEKVVSYYEQLVAASGKPTPFELERLGQVYAQLGDMDKARATWNRIVEQNPDDPKAYATLAKALTDAGMTEEALAAKAKALELDPEDYRLRLTYAQELANADQMDKAVEQLQTLLEIGDPKKKEEGEQSREKKVNPISRGGASRLMASTYHGRGYVRYYGGPAQRGSFQDYRNQAISMMAGMAESTVGIDNLLDEYRKKIESNPTNIGTKRDLLQIYMAVNRNEDAVKQVEELMASQPDDVELLDLAASLYSRQQNLDKSIQTLLRVAELEPLRRKQVLLGVYPLYLQRQNEDEAAQTMSRLLEEFGDDPAVLSQIVNHLQRANRMDQVKTLRDRVEALEPRYRGSLRLTLAQAYQQTGEKEEAIRLAEEALFGEPDLSRTIYARTRQANLYVPQPPDQRSNRGYYGARSKVYELRDLGVISSYNTDKVRAFDALLTADLTDEQKASTLARMEEKAKAYASASTIQERDEAWEMGRLLIAYYLGERDYDRVAQYLAQFREAGLDSVEWYNLKVHLNEVEEKYETVFALYDEVAQRHPQLAGEVEKARVNVHIITGNYRAAAEGVRQLIHKRVPPAELIARIRLLHQAGERELAKALLEEHLSGMSRNSDALMLLAEIHAEDNDYAKAMEIAREAWERKAQGSQGRGMRYYSGYGYYYAGPSGRSDLLTQLYRYAQGAGKSAELVAEFEDRLAKQPGSVEAHRNLAALYGMNNEVDKALGVWLSLSEKRPNLTEAKTSRAELLESKGLLREAVAVYEEMIKTSPNLYRSMSWRIRNLYQRTGKAEELNKLEKDLVAKASNPDQMQELAQRFYYDGEYDKAIDLYERAVKAAPDRSWMHGELANAYLEAGRTEEALQTYARWIDSPMTHGQGWVDFHAINSMVSLFYGLGRMDELKTKNEADLAKAPTDRIAQAIRAEIAFREKRFSEAVQLFAEIFAKTRDSNAVNELISAAEFAQDTTATVELLEKSGMTQNYYDPARLARLYLATGDASKAYEALGRMTTLYGGSYGYREAFMSLVAYGLWAQAEEFYGKHRPAINPNDWEGREMDRAAVALHVSGRGFKDLVEKIGETKVRPQDEPLVSALIEARRHEPQWALPFIAKLLEKDPENKNLLSAQARVLAETGRLEEAARAYRKLIEKEPNQANHRTQLARVLARSGNEPEAVNGLAAWAMERPALDRVQPYADFLQELSRGAEVLKLIDQTLATIDPSQREEVERIAAGYMARMGDADGAAKTYRAHFERRRDTNTFQHYLSFLMQHGYEDEAYKLFTDNRESGFLDAWRGDSGHLAPLCIERGDIATLVDLAWKFTAFGERWNRENFLRNVLDAFRQAGDVRKFLVPYEERVLAQEKPDPQLLALVAQQHVEIGNVDRAVELYDRALAMSPYNVECMRGKAGALQAARRFDEALELAKSPAGGFDLQQEIASRLQLASLYFKLHRKEEALTVLNELAAWAISPDASIQIGQAYLEQRMYAEALPFLEKGARMERHGDARTQLAKCYVKTGRLDDAIEVWDTYQENRQPDTFPQWLFDEKLYEAAERVLGVLIQRDPARADVYVMLARTQLKRGDQPAAFRSLADGYARFSGAPVDAPMAWQEFEYDEFPERGPATRGNYLAQAGALLADEGAVAPALDEGASDPLLAPIAASGFRVLCGRKNKDAANAVKDRAGALAANSFDVAMALAQAYYSLDDKPTSAQWYRKAAEAGDLALADKLSVARGLFGSGDAGAASALFEVLVAGQPSLLVREPAAMKAIAKTGPPQRVQAALEQIQVMVPYEGHYEYFAALTSYYAGDKSAALPKLLALIDTPRLRADHLQAVAELLYEEGMTDNALRACDRLAGTGYGAGPRRMALNKAVEWAAASHPAKAIPYYARLISLPDFAAWETGRKLSENVKPEHLADVRETVANVVTAAPHKEPVSDLIGWYSQVAERCDQVEPADALAETWGVAGAEREEARLWDGLVEDWRILGPLPADGPLDDTGTTSIEQTLLAAAEPIDLDGAPWTVANAKETLGFVELGGEPEATYGAPNQNVAYAMTRLESSDDREVTLSIGCATYLRVWVNGEDLLVHRGSGRIRPDQRRIVARLRTGDNFILVKTVGFQKQGLFSMGVLEGDGVRVTLENSPGMTAAARR
ncbi:MAG: hypothetical protein AMXMBFR4_21170 [Candidatus Hydrogenedentota bacterium]